MKLTSTTLAASLATTALASGAVVDIESATFTGTGNDQTISSFTAGGVTYTGLTGAVATTAASERYFGDTDPGSDAAALTGLVATDGTLNTTSGTDFILGPLTSDSVLFLLEYDFSTDDNAQFDDVRLGLIDTLGNDIGDYRLELVDVGEDASGSLLNPSLNREGTGTFLNENLYGTSFTLADFTGTTGDLTLAAGVTIINSNPGSGGTGGAIDVAAVGVAVIPEPASALAASAGMLGLLTRRRRA
jgi:hypothetical protein